MYIEFMTEYWYLFATLLVVVLLLSFDPASTSVSGSKMIAPAKLPHLQSRENAIIVDVNESEQFKAGHISQAINIPFGNLSNSIGKLTKHKKKPVVLTCNTGANSKKAVAILKKNEISDIYVLAGGLTAWKKENLPLEKS
jgi:rhodanese-related sulfurtransferase